MTDVGRIQATNEPVGLPVAFNGRPSPREGGAQSQRAGSSISFFTPSTKLPATDFCALVTFHYVSLLFIRVVQRRFLLWPGRGK